MGAYNLPTICKSALKPFVDLGKLLGKEVLNTCLVSVKYFIFVIFINYLDFSGYVNYIKFWGRIKSGDKVKRIMLENPSSLKGSIPRQQN